MHLNVFKTCPDLLLGAAFLQTGTCIATAVRRRAASTKGAASGFELEVSWEDTEEESGYVRVSDVTVLQPRIAPIHTARVRDLAELRQNVSSRQQQQRHRRAMMADAAAANGVLPTRPRITRSGRASRDKQSTGAGALARLQPLGQDQSTPWWVERASMPSDLSLPALKDRSASTGGVMGVARRKQQPQWRSRTRHEPAVQFRPNTPVHDRLTALKEHALAKKMHATADAQGQLKDWPSALLRHYYVHGEGTETLKKTRAIVRNDSDRAVSETADSSIAISDED